MMLLHCTRSGVIVVKFNRIVFCDLDLKIVSLVDNAQHYSIYLMFIVVLDQACL